MRDGPGRRVRRGREEGGRGAARGRVEGTIPGPE